MIEMNSPQAVHHRMEEGLNDQTDIGNEMRGTERGHKSLSGDMKNTGSEEKRVRVLKEMMVTTAIVEGAGKESTAEKKERKGTTTVMMKKNLEKRIKSCIRGKP